MSDQCDIIAVFGISGVGKSTLIEGFIKDHPEYAHIQAGTLIRQALKNIPRDKLRIADTDTIIKNQHLLIDEFWKEIKENCYSSIIFDGHSIIDTGAVLIEIPISIIEAIKPQKIIFIQDEPQHIFLRRKADMTRQRAEKSLEQIKEEQDRAIKQARYYAETIKIPFAAITSGDLKALYNYIV